jgi:tetratricopeptide (TPR) repeat protein
METYPSSAVLNVTLGKCHFELGQIEHAIASYQKAIEIKPQWAVGFIMLGQIHSAQGNQDQAIENLEKAIELEPNNHELCSTIGAELLQKGDTDEAVKYLEQALKQNPNSSSALSMMGDAYNQKGDHDLAITYLERAISLDPDNAIAHFNMGSALHDNGDHKAAIKSYKNAIKIKPDYAEAYSNLGNVQRDKGDLDAAIKSFKKALILDPNCAATYYNLGISFQDNRNPAAAIESYEKALAINPNYSKAYNNLGTSLIEQGDLTLAITNFKKASKIQPDHAEIFLNLGVAQKNMGDLDSAINSYGEAIKIKPDYAEAYYNLGNALDYNGDLDASITSMKQAIKIKPDFPDASYGLSLAYLAKGDFLNGWIEYDSRFKIEEASPIPPIKKKLKGSLNKKTRLLLREEQGIGDQIMFSSAISEIYKICSQLIIQTDQRLIPIFKRSFPQDIIFYSNKQQVPTEQYDDEIYMGSAFKDFRPNLSSFKQSCGIYLKAELELTKKLRKQLLTGRNSKIVGISWKGGSMKNCAPTNKSIELSQIALLLNSENVQLVNLQYGDTTQEIKDLKNEYGISVIDLSEIDNLNNLDGFAALINACDHVVSIDNLTVHMAGALGVKTSVLLPFSPEWRWGKTAKDSYIHSSLTLYRKTSISDWTAPLNELEGNLSNLLAHQENVQVDLKS